MNDPSSLFPLSDLLTALGDGAQAPQGEAFGDSFALQLEALEGAEIHVIAFRGVEQMSALYAFDVLFWVAGLPELDVAETCLARRARLVIPTPAGPRTVQGIGAAVELVGVHRERAVYRLRLTPEAWLLSRRTDTRVFQDLTVPAVIGAVLRARGLAHVFNLAATYAPRRYCLQYEETDLAFITRLAAEEGIFFCIDQLATDEEARGAGAEHAMECLLFGDTKALYAPIPGSPRLEYAPDATGALAHKESQVTAFRAASTVASNVATVRGYEYTLASYRGPDEAGPTTAAQVRGVSQAAHAAAPGAAGLLEVYEHHSDYEDSSVLGKTARTRLEQLRAAAVEGTGITWCRRLSPGCSFRLDDHEVAALDREYAVTRVRHEGNARRAPGTPAYRCEFSCVPADVPFRPAHPPRRVHQAVETGVVVGPASEDIETERHGCVRVQFHWDRRGRHDEHSSCWIRVMQPWAGPSYGFSFVPRVGMEVLVSFIGGDVDRPVVIGCLPNPGNAPPMVLPQDKTQSAIRTHSTPGDEGGYNEILFEDRHGGEVLALHAQRDHDVVANHDHLVRVGNDQVTRVGANRRVAVAEDDEVAVVGDRVRTVGGASTETVCGDAKLLFGAAHAVEIAGDSDVQIGGQSTVTVAGALTSVVGRLGAEGRRLSITTGVHRIVAGKELRLDSPTAIHLVCGSSSIVLRPDGIELRGQRLTLLGEEAVDTKVGDSEIRVGETIAVLSKEIAQRSAGAAVLLAAAAQVTPPWVPSAHGPLGKQRKEGPPSPGVATFKIDVPPGTKGPLTLRIATPTGEIVERQTDDDFVVRMDGLDGDEFVLVEVMSGDHPVAHARQAPSPT